MQDNILFEIRSDIGLIKKDQSNLYLMVEKLAHSVEKITDSLKAEQRDLLSDHNKINERLIKLEEFVKNKKQTVSVWVAPIFCSILASAVTARIVNLISHLS